ncbi:MAG: bacillithiol biosynthesis deacetylase BshB1 [Planctomycetes bacterium]|nr:bacillithiol biosynthesis deacetylase BshB1 [Planctomycetota bacterium]
MSGFDASVLPNCDVLAFGPHPDDVEIACGGTLLLMKQAGMKVAIVDCTRGEMGSRGTAADRDAEAAAAAKALGLDARANLGLKDTGIRDDDASTDLVVAAMRAARPKVVFAPHERDVHPDHSNASKLIGRAHFLSGLRNYRPELGTAHRAQTLLRYPGNQLVEPTFVVDISAVAEQKADVVRCYRSQLAPDDKSHLMQGLDLLDRAIVRQRAMGATIAAVAGEGFCHEGPLPIHDPARLTH